MKVNLEKGYNGFMRYHDITKDDMLNGDGLRVVLWVAGCSHHCKGCQNPITWDPEGGVLFDESAKQEIFEQLDKPYIEGITFSGGDPLHEKNVDEVTAFAREIQDLPIVSYLDVIVDGKFDLERRDVSLPWKGSPNQRVIDVPKSREVGLVVLHA